MKCKLIYVAAAVWAGGPVHAQSAYAGPDPDWVSQAKLIADLEGVPVGQAVSRAIMQNRILDEADRLSREPGYAGAKIIRTGAALRVEFRHKRGTPKPILKLQDVVSAADFTEVERSLADLETDRKNVIGQLARAKLGSTLIVDEDTNRLILSVSDLDKFNQLKGNGSIKLPDYVEVRQGAAVFKTEASVTGAGGMLNAAGTHGCTGGFIASYNGQRGLTSAGHCTTIGGGMTTHRGGALGTAYPTWNQQGYDLTLYRNTANTYLNRVTLDYDNTSYTITNVAASIAAQASVCVVIRNGTQKCGFVWKPSASGTTADGTAYGPWVMMDRYFTAGGDSGGPYLYGARAFGSHVGYVCPDTTTSCYSVFMGAPAMTAVGVNIAVN